MKKPIFIFPNYLEHKRYREITKNCPLTVRRESYVKYDFAHMDYETRKFLSDDLILQKWFDPKIHYYHSGGLNLTNRYVELRHNFPVRQVGFRMPGSYCYDYDCPTAFEVLSYGVGIFQWLNPPLSGFNKIFGGDGLPFVTSEYRTVSKDFLGIQHQKERYMEGYTEHSPIELEMTNLIYADTYGELEQLLTLNRATLKNYLAMLNKIHFHTWEHVSHRNTWLGFLLPYWDEHVQKGLWKAPPKSVKELLKRVEYILENTYVDDNPQIILKIGEFGKGCWKKEVPDMHLIITQPGQNAHL